MYFTNCKFLCVIFFIYITNQIIKNTKEKVHNLSFYFTPVVIGVTSIMPTLLIIKMKKLSS